MAEVNSRGTLSMKAGSLITGNTSSSSSFSSGRVFVWGIFTMSGGTVSGNLLSGTDSLLGREVWVYAYGTFKISGSAWPERVFLSDNVGYITIAGPLSAGIPIDLGVTSNAPITTWKNARILRLDSAYGGGDLASLKQRFTLGNTKMTSSPWTEIAITGYRINDNGELVAAP